MKLARELGHIDVDQMLSLITKEKFDEWIDADTIDPFGDPWDRTAMMLATLLNKLEEIAGILSNTPPGKLVTPEDVIPRPEHLKAPKPKADVVAQLDRLSAQTGGM